MPVETRAMSETKSPVKAGSSDKMRLRPRAFTDYRSLDQSLDLDEDSFPDNDSGSEERPKTKAKVHSRMRPVPKERLDRYKRSKRTVFLIQEQSKAKKDTDAGMDHPVSGSKSDGATTTDTERIDLDHEEPWPSRLRKCHKDASKLEESEPLEKTIKARPKNKTLAGKTKTKKNLNHTNDLSFLDQFESMAISDPGPCKHLKSRRPVNRKKLTKIVPKNPRSPINLVPEPEPGPEAQAVQGPQVISPLQSAAHFLMMSSAGLVSAAVMVYILNLPCL